MGSLFLATILSFTLSIRAAQQTPVPTSTAYPSMEPTSEVAKPDFIGHYNLPGHFGFVLQKNVNVNEPGCGGAFRVGCKLVYKMDGNGNSLTLINTFAKMRAEKSRVFR